MVTPTDLIKGYSLPALRSVIHTIIMIVCIQCDKMYGVENEGGSRMTGDGALGWLSALAEGPGPIYLRIVDALADARLFGIAMKALPGSLGVEPF